MTIFPGQPDLTWDHEAWWTQSEHRNYDVFNDIVTYGMHQWIWGSFVEQWFIQQEYEDSRPADIPWNSDWWQSSTSELQPNFEAGCQTCLTWPPCCMDDTHKSSCHETQYLFPGNHSGSRSLWKRCNPAVLRNLAYPNARKISMYDRLGQSLTGHHVSLGHVFSTGPDHGTKCCQEGLNVIRPASLHYHGCMVNVETYHFKHITFQHGIQRSRFVDKRIFGSFMWFFALVVLSWHPEAHWRVYPWTHSCMDIWRTVSFLTLVKECN